MAQLAHAALAPRGSIHSPASVEASPALPGRHAIVHRTPLPAMPGKVRWRPLGRATLGMGKKRPGHFSFDV